MTQAFTLYLDDIEHLFVAPDFDMHSAHPRETSGMDSLLLQLQVQNQPYPNQLVIYLPAEQITADLPERVNTAIRRYGDMKIKQAADDLVALRRQGVRTLIYGLTFLAVCLVIAYLGQTAAFLSPAMSGFIFNGFTIIGWVSLWHPTEALLFGWFEPWRDRRLYRYIETMDFVIKAA